jgi:hypothetical protein
MAGSRADARTLRAPAFRLEGPALIRELLPLLSRGPDGKDPNPDDLLAWIETRLGAVAATLLTWNQGERQFLERLLGDGVIEAGFLHPDATVQELVRRQPMLQWKSQHVRQHRRGVR